MTTLEESAQAVRRFPPIMRLPPMPDVLRASALRIAHNSDDDPATVIKRAETYYAFLTAKTEPEETSNG